MRRFKKTSHLDNDFRFKKYKVTKNQLNFKDTTSREQSEMSELTMSVPKSIHKMVTVPNGNGTSHKMKIKNGEISGMLEVKV